MGKNIIVTGASGAAGSAIVDKLARAGNQVLAISRSSSSAFPGGNVYTYSADLADEEQAKKVFDHAVDRFETIDAAVFAAGGFAAGNFNNTGKDELQRMFSINFETAYFLSRLLLEKMIGQSKGGRMVFFGSRPGLEPDSAKGSIAYALSKSLVFQLSGLINAVGGKNNVVSCVIAPSIIDSQANRLAMAGADTSKWVPVEHIAEMVEFICSENGSAIRNSVIKMYGNS